MGYYYFIKAIIVIIIFSGINYSAGAVDVKKPVFSAKRGFYDNAFQLTLSPRPANAIIRYTLDGSAPTLKHGTIYKTPISITKTTFVRALSYITGGDSSSVVTHTYIFFDNVMNQKNSSKKVFWSEEFDMKDVGNATEEDIKKALVDIPSVSFVTEEKKLFSPQGIHWASNLNDTLTVPVSMEMIYPKGYKGDKFNSWHENCGLRIQGGAGRKISGKFRDLKQSFSALFKNVYGAGKLRHDIFAAAPFNARSASGTYDRIIFRAGHNDNWANNWDPMHSTYTRDEMSRVLQLSMSGWGSHGTYVHLYLNGKYWGLYNPCERADDNMMANYFGGTEDDYSFAKAKERHVKGAVPKYDSLLQKNFENSSLAEISQFVYLDNFADLVILFAYANPGDGQQFYYGYNTKFNTPLLFAAWDLEASFGGGMQRTGDPSASLGDQGIRCSKNILQNPEFLLKVADRAYKHGRNDGILTDMSVKMIWDSLNRVIEKAILCETARWGDEHKKVPNWNTAKNLVRKDFSNRADKLFKALKGGGLYPSVDPPLFFASSRELKISLLKVIPGFSLTMKSNGGAIYYTLDGSDPRKSDLSDGIGSTAKKYGSSPLTFKKTTLLKARVLNNGIWSAVHEIMIIVNDSYKELKITEIHYHPSADGNIDGDNFEFIELKNTGTNPLNMTGVSFDMGINYTFKSGVILDPGKFIVLASAVDRFIKRYKFSPFGIYRGKLKNSGETVRLADAAGDLIDSVAYRDTLPWPKEADGEGYSLAPKRADRKGDPNASTSWLKSSRINGTPGSDDPKSIGAVISHKNTNTPNSAKKHTVCRVGRFCFLIPFKKDFQVSILNLQGRVITDLAQRSKLRYHWTPRSNGMFFVRFTSKYGKQVVKKVMIIR